MIEEKIWAWLLPSGKIYKVVTNSEDGTISVYDQNGELVKKEENLSGEAVNLIETKFLETVATVVGGKKMKMVNELTDEIGMYIR